MIDYDLTIQNFFESVDKYLTDYMTQAYDTYEYYAIDTNLQKIRRIAKNPRVNTNRKLRNDDNALQFDGSGFVHAGSKNFDVYNAFVAVIVAIEKYYWTGDVVVKSQPGSDKNQNRKFMLGNVVSPMSVRQELLYAIKNWVCVTSPNIFKNIICFFTPAHVFAAHIVPQKKK